MFEAYNENGKLQFNTEVFTFSSVSKGSFYINNNYIDVDGNSVYVDTSGSTTVAHEVDMVFFSCASIYIVPEYGNVGDGTAFVGASAFPSVINAPGALVNFWTFKRVAQTTAGLSNLGLQLFNASGQVIYSAIDHRPLRITNTYPITSMGVAWNPTYTLSSGRTYAFARFGTTQRWGTDETGNDNHVTAGCRIDGTSVSFKESPGYSGRFYIDAYTGGIMVADVSGYN